MDNLDFILLAEKSQNFLTFTRDFCVLAVTSPLDDETLKNLFWIGANFHQRIDLPDTSNLNWKEAIIRCLESVATRSRTQPDPEPGLQPSTAENSCVPPADGELPPAATHQPEPEIKRTELTLAPEEELQQESDQGCEPTTSEDEGTQSTDYEDWLKDSSEETPVPTLSHPSSAPSSSDPSSDCVYPVVNLSDSTAPLHSASSPAPTLLDVHCPTSSLGRPPDFEMQVSPPSAAPRHEDLVAPPPASVLCTPSRPVDLPALSWLLPPTPPPETLEPSAAAGSLVLPAPPWSVVTLSSPRTYGLSATLRPSTPSATAGSSFSSASPLSSVTPPPPLLSGTLAPPPVLVAAMSPGSPRPGSSLESTGSPAAPMDPATMSPSVIPQLPSASSPPGLFHPSTLPWAVGCLAARLRTSKHIIREEM
ncbi:uncharacterized protein LOC130102021 [Rhinichthys klamathensis goyatoka]|uniref:uncharacterized protein LOC130102021 n=1 Tax=Rhinichthys klamathensis goyatoka TaxID=3034132 RepID=UPI0024B510D7|nr:uncharacterized protein LOC130102021 [Rhinichthys klamathensis goyatoka]